jgi:hypothetical protein
MQEPIAGYISQDLYLPRDFDDEFSDLLVDAKRSADKPFPRKVDLWWSTICIGAALGEFRSVPKDRIKFNTGQVFANEQWRVAHMELLALARDGEKALKHPTRVVEIAEEYGMAGIEWITARLRGSNRPAFKLLMELEELGGGPQIELV